MMYGLLLSWRIFSCTSYKQRLTYKDINYNIFLCASIREMLAMLYFYVLIGLHF